MYFNFHNDGEKRTDEFEAFNRAHWSRDDYENKYLLWVYGESDDDLIDATEISHHLPDTRTQQYYEMTGKYDQFSWGWDDARFNGNTINDYSDLNPPDRITGDALAPNSARRDQYETMRNDANNQFDKATKMVMLSMVNRLVSGLEAYFVTKKRNRNVTNSDDEFTRHIKPSKSLASWKVSPKLKSIHSRRDTPYLKVTYKF
jgi:hypothetical protein